ncbi:MAG: hypothetical protein GX794_01530, partial [Acholeplasmataceae bacterium]|nr:hypothetical protein [Acholeplasmataceae bacterium]
EYVITYSATNSLGTTYFEVTVIVREKPDGPDYTLYDGYYSLLEGLTGTALKTQLQNIITTFENSNNPNYTVSYDSANNHLQAADKDLSNPNNIILIYNGNSIKAPWDSGSTWNKEHVWAKSLLTFPGGGEAGTKTNGPGADLHNLRACNPSINSTRGNKEFAAGSGSYGSSGTGWYPGDNHIGDVARIILYMNLRWGDSLANISKIGSLNLFLQWHLADPVDAFEINRNQQIHTLQGNRNPFIDYPELVTMIWGSPNKKSYSNFYNEFNVIMTQVEEESTLSINYDVLNTYSNLKVTYYQISKESFYN